MGNAFNNNNHKSPTVILVITDNLPDQVNGVVTTYKKMERYALEEGYEIKYIDSADFPGFQFPFYPEVKIALPRGLKQMIEAINPAYVHIATEGPLGWAASMILTKMKIPYTTCYHTKYPEIVHKLCWIPPAITCSYMRWFHNRADAVYVNTVSLAKELKEMGISKPLVEWSKGADDPSFNTSVKRAPRGRDEKPHVVYVGRVSQEKGIDDLCKLSDRYQITVVGDGPYLEHLKAVYPLVKYVGYKHGSELSEYYGTADVFCFPSRADTFGIVNIEAMIHGTPVAAYPVTGPIDIIEAGKTGYVNDDLVVAIEACLKIDRKTVKAHGAKWTWKRCWEIFRDNIEQPSK